MKRMKWLGGLVVALSIAGAAAAADFPKRALTVVVPYPAGGASDGTVRAYTNPMSTRLGQPVVVDNLGGAGGAVAAQKVLAAPADGYQMIFGSPNELILTPLLNPAIKYKPEDFNLLQPNALASLVVLVRPGLPVNSVDELIALARKASAEGKPLSYGSTGIGSAYHLVAEDFGQRIGAKLNHVPYKGGAPLVVDLAGDQVDFSLLAFQTSMEALVEQGRLKILASLNPERAGKLAHLPTANESEPLKGFTFRIWGGFFVRKGTPDEVFEKLQATLAEARNDPVVQSYRDGQRLEKVPDMSRQELAKFYQDEVARYQALARKIDLKPE